MQWFDHEDGGILKTSETSDNLAGIAARGAHFSRELAEQPPMVLPDLWLPSLGRGDSCAFFPHEPATPDSLRQELASLRASMQPFLDDRTPPLIATRRGIPIGTAEWRLEPSNAWTGIPLPHYGGPLGRARSWYRMNIQLEASDLEVGSIWVCFGGADYRVAVFLNGHLAGTHEGFFSPFEFEITEYARFGENELLVRLDNDAIFMGNNSWDDPRQGDKLYGATGLGWDEPGLGWHHCPPGMGLHRPIRIECRPKVFLGDLFVRPLPQEESAEVWVEVHQTGERPEALTLELAVHAQNFDALPVLVGPLGDLPPADSGINRYRVRISLPGFRLWSPSAPWLYRTSVILRCGGSTDTSAVSFGMRSFVLDESPGPDGRRGRFLLNGDPIRLRGANTMGHEQVCVFRGDLEQLRDDILLAKLANLNFLRFTQRPVEAEVYDMCDRLGMMAQTDLPLFARLRRNKFAEALRQSVEMERLVRSHPSNVLVSFINEPFPAAWGDQSHRHLTRDELEGFFQAAACAVRVENPDRQIKPIDGDYEPPGPGLPDSHCYAGWYNGHGLDLGKLHKGYWIDTKPGWNYACGEYGSEGLEDEALMRSCYPPDWLPNGDEEKWTPAVIAKCQSGGAYHLWFEPGRSIAEWVQRSQSHQAWITRLMTEAFRRDNRMVSSAIHLLIDAWPAGWMKTVMDCRRNPKPAYFALREALAPAAVFFRIDRTAFFAGETPEAEMWVCNDLPRAEPGWVVTCQIERGGKVFGSGDYPVRLAPCEAVFQGRLGLTLQRVDERTRFHLRAALRSPEGEIVHETSLIINVFPDCGQVRQQQAFPLGGVKAAELASFMLGGGFVCDDPAHLTEALEHASAGANVLLTEFPAGNYDIAGSLVRVEDCDFCPRHFVARAPGCAIAQSFEENDFRFWYDPVLDRPAPLLHTLFYADDSWKPILCTGQGGWGRKWEPAIAAAWKQVGKGRMILCQLTLAGRLANPAARLLLHRLGLMGGA